MPYITKEELIKLANISHINLQEQDIPRLTKEIDAILSYACFLKDVAAGHKKVDLPQNSNIMREDVVIKTDAEALLAQAPERQENYFVVPRILK